METTSDNEAEKKPCASKDVSILAWALSEAEKKSHPRISNQKPTLI